MKQVSLTPEQVNAIYGHHIRTVDKWYRMLYGISSKLKSVKNGVASLEIDINLTWKRTNVNTAYLFIRDWRRFNSDLKGVESWNVQIFLVQNIAGYMVRLDEVNTEKTQRLIDLMNADPKRQLIFELEALEAGDNEFIVFWKNSEDTVWNIFVSADL